MVQFNELRITSDGQYMIIDVSVPDIEEYFSNIYIDKIVIDSYENYTGISGPSDKPVYQDSVPSSENRKNYRWVIPSGGQMPNYHTTLFYVYVYTKGEFGVGIPCYMENRFTMGSVADVYRIYQKTIQYMKEVNSSCKVPKHFVDMLLRFKALDLSIRTGHYTEANLYWKRFFSDMKDVTPIKNCACDYGLIY